MEVIPYKVVHGLMDAYALRIIIDGKVLAYSGDTCLCNQIITAARGADLFLCEAGTNNSDDKLKQNLHLTAYQAGGIAKKAGVKHLVLVHYSGKDSKEKIIREVSKFNNELKLQGFKAFQIEDDGSETRTYSRKEFYKICLTTGKSKIHYSDKTYEQEGTILFFG